MLRRPVHTIISCLLQSSRPLASSFNIFNKQQTFLLINQQSSLHTNSVLNEEKTKRTREKKIYGHIFTLITGFVTLGVVWDNER